VEETVRALLAATRAHAAFLLRPWGEQALANVMRVTELARAYEVGGGISFRGFVTRLREEAEAEVPEAPIVEEASEGVRLMTVHRAKGLEFPIVVLADFTANIAPERPSRHVDAERGICALGLSGWLPLDLLEHEAEELARERAEGVRVAYVAATRARDLLVVPAVGDDPRESGWEAAEDAWVAPVQRAIYPVAARRRASAPAPGCPAFGEDSVLVRPDRDAPGAENVRPGLHPFGAGDDAYAAVWWDPSRLALGVKPLLGLRRRELLEDPGPDIVDADRKAYADWLSARAATIEYGSRPSVVVETVTEWISRAGRGRAAPEVSARAAAVEVVRLPRHDPSPSGEAPSPSGPRYGTLVHAILAAVPLDGDRVQVETMATLQGRILGATADEITSAAAAVSRALAHPLLARAREAWRAGKCRREVPITLRISDPAREESLIEGVVDVAFQDDAGWTVIDFKTDHELDGRLDRYRRQVALYATAIAQAVDATATAVLVAL
jgi:ATP-dependent exoDNAse (exonuclease V) beta subunit